jgi:hypothetical protein
VVAVAAGRVMAKKATEQRYARRAKLMNYARTLARSGEHADHKSIIAHLATLEGFEAVRGRFEDRAFHAQLDKLCALARGAAPELTSRRTRRGIAKPTCQSRHEPECKSPPRP